MEPVHGRADHWDPGRLGSRADNGRRLPQARHQRRDLLAGEGIVMNHKKLRRLYREGRLHVRRRGGRKRAIGTRMPITRPGGPNQRWSLDFISDAFVDWRRFRVLTIVADFTRECLALITDTSLSGARVPRELDAIVAWHGRPAAVITDQWNRAHQRGDLALDATAPTVLALYRTRQAATECVGGVLLRPVAG